MAGGLVGRWVEQQMFAGRHIGGHQWSWMELLRCLHIARPTNGNEMTKRKKPTDSCKYLFDPPRIPVAFVPIDDDGDVKK